jgi:5-methyltetrahydropteroyltriglutamate--homocysteine methyltransferase
MPLKGRRYEFLEGAKRSQTLTQYTGYGEWFSYVKVFEDQVVSGLVDKMRAGIDVPTYPQYRDMNEMFLDMINGLTKTPRGYMASGKLSVEPGKMIPEVYAVRNHLSEVAEASSVGKVGLKVCVTGPYTLSRSFATRTPELFTELGELLSEVTSNSIFKAKRGETALVSIDEPAFGLADDPILDVGYPGRECLRKAWEEVSYAANSRGVETMIHLHSTTDNLMWEVGKLDIIGSHVSDPIYGAATNRLLSETGKRLSISVATTSFEELLARDAETPEDIGYLWEKIRRGETDPSTYLESTQIIAGRLNRSLRLFGEENVPYAGPECGLGGFPTYECAIQYLERISRVVKHTNVDKSNTHS